ncbi:16S rRNA (uracil(1498)-N(3))-methyltransferase [Elongatibacter sediminis]|uniref:Ribosomal RNA small subunit methyltransferase E n=1 Tax=Elongatibacter sediminis TaxID=3119006 RepID=A0AAW9RE30_9GAMM
MTKDSRYGPDRGRIEQREISLRIPRVHVDCGIEPGHTLALPRAQAHYVGRVLRLGTGSPLVLFNGDGCDYAAELVHVSKSGAEARIEARLPGIPPSPLSITLVQALSRGERMDQALQKATELGAAAFQPVITARCGVRLDDRRLDKRMAHWRGVIISACEQCGRSELPELRAPMSLVDWAASSCQGSPIALDPASRHSFRNLEASGSMQVLIGPEGGFDDRERSVLEGAGVESVRFGTRILRTETAGPAVIAALQAAAGDLN